MNKGVILPDGLAEELSPSSPSYPDYIGALSSLKRRWRHLSIDIRGDTDITGSNQFPNGSGLRIPGASCRLVLTCQPTVKMCRLAVK